MLGELSKATNVPSEISLVGHDLESGLKGKLCLHNSRDVDDDTPREG
jgi:hypothetical protein